MLDIIFDLDKGKCFKIWLERVGFFVVALINRQDQLCSEKRERGREGGREGARERGREGERDLILSLFIFCRVITQPAFTRSKLTIETLEQGVKYVQS